MAVDATGTPSSPDNIPTYNTGADAPSGKGLNNIVASLQGLFTALRAGTMPGGKIAPAGITPGTNGQVFQTVGGVAAWAAAPATTVFKISTAVDVVNTAAETTLFDQAITAGVMGTDKMLRVTILSSIANNSGSGATPTFRIYFGGTKFVDYPLISLASGTAQRRPADFQFHIANLGATNAQYLNGRWAADFSTTGGTGNPTTGEGFNGNNGQIRWFGANGMTIDTTASQNVKVTIQWSAANAALSWKMWYALIEVVG